MERRDFTYSQYSVQFYMKVKDRIWKKKSRIPNGAHLLDEGIQNISTHGKASFDWIGFFPESCEIELIPAYSYAISAF